MTAGSGQARFAKEGRDWLLYLDELSIKVEECLTVVGAACIAILVFGLPLLLLIADHVSLLKILSGP